MLRLTKYNIAAATTPPNTGEITQLAAICPIFAQSTIAKPLAAMPEPIMAPTIECVVETGAPTAVAMFSHKAAANNAAIINQTKVSESGIKLGSIMPLRMVPTTSPPAINAPAASKIAAMTNAPTSVKALEPTAGPTLLATSFAPIFIAIYAPMAAATTNTKALSPVAPFMAA